MKRIVMNVPPGTTNVSELKKQEQEIRTGAKQQQVLERRVQQGAAILEEVGDDEMIVAVTMAQCLVADADEKALFGVCTMLVCKREQTNECYAVPLFQDIEDRIAFVAKRFELKISFDELRRFEHIGLETSLSLKEFLQNFLTMGVVAGLDALEASEAILQYVQKFTRWRQVNMWQNYYSGLDRYDFYLTTAPLGGPMIVQINAVTGQSKFCILVANLKGEIFKFRYEDFDDLLDESFVARGLLAESLTNDLPQELVSALITNMMPEEPDMSDTVLEGAVEMELYPTLWLNKAKNTMSLTLTTALDWLQDENPKRLRAEVGEFKCYCQPCSGSKIILCGKEEA